MKNSRRTGANGDILYMMKEQADKVEKGGWLGMTDKYKERVPDVKKTISEEVVKSCDNCKHSEKQDTEYPCSVCRGNEYPMWKAKIANETDFVTKAERSYETSCLFCRHLVDTSEKEPCNGCFDGDKFEAKKVKKPKLTLEISEKKLKKIQELTCIYCIANNCSNCKNNLARYKVKGE